MADPEKKNTGPLHGLKVLDLTEERGLYTGKVLADMGADVVLIEKPTGSCARSRGPFKGDVPGKENSLYFLNFNMNKKGITLNLDNPSGRDIFKHMVKSADVVVEDSPVGRMLCLGLDYPALAKVNPKIIMAAISGFGSSGPYAQYKGPDIVSMAMGGLTYINGPPDAAPATAPCEQSHHTVSVTAVFGIIAALLLRNTTGKGQFIDLSAQRAVETATGGVWFYSTISSIQGRSGSQFGAVPGRIFQCKDGYVHILTIRANHWQGLLEVMGNPEIFREEKWLTMEFRNANPDIIDAFVTEFTMAHNKMEIIEMCQAKGVPCAPVNTPADFYNDPHIKQRGVFTEIEHPVAGRFPFVRPVCNFNGIRYDIKRPAPLLGQHNHEIYRQELGLSEPEMAKLKSEGVI